MVSLVAVGTFLIAAGPVLALILVVLLPNPHLVVLATIAAFTWSLAMSLSGAVYWMIPPLRQAYPWLLFVTVTMQEGTRLGLYEVFRYMFRSGDGVQAFLRPGAKNETLTGLSIGAGFGFLSVLVNFYSAVIDEFRDDTAVYTDTCSLNFFVAASLYALAFAVLHVTVAVLVWPAYTDRNWAYIFAGYFLHLGVAEATLANRRNGGCHWGIGLVYVLVLLATVGTAVLSSVRIRKETI
jgi:Aph-1 protein